MEYIDPEPDSTYPYTIFDAREGFVIDRSCCYESAFEGYGLSSDFGRMVVIIRSAPALTTEAHAYYHV